MTPPFVDMRENRVRAARAFAEQFNRFEWNYLMLASLRRNTGLPHRIVVDEARYFLHDSNVQQLLDLELGAYTLVTYRPSDLHPDVRKAMEVVFVTRTTQPQEVKAIQTMSGNSTDDWSTTLAGLAIGEAVLLPSAQEALGKLQRFSFYLG